MKLSGVFSALPTPFKDGEVDYTSLIKLVHDQLKNGIDGFVVMGTTAESSAIPMRQKESIFDIIKLQCSDDFPIIVGTGTNNTKDTIDKSRKAISWGASAVMCVVPYYNKPPQRGLLEHFSKISAALEDTPVLIYNVPSRTITSLTTETIKSLSEFKNVIGIKEASGDMNFDSDIMKSVGKDFSYLSGDDLSYLQFLEIGGNGIVSVASNIIPKEMKSIFTSYKDGKAKEATSLFNQIKPLLEALTFESNPIPIKAALNINGIFSTSEVISPLSQALDDDVKKLKSVMSEVIK